MKKSFLIIMILMSVGYIGSQAQEYRTDISIREQIVNNKQPNVAYTSKTETSQGTKIKGFTGSSLAKSMKDGKMNIPISNSSGSQIKKSTPAAQSSTVLPSEISSEQTKKEMETKKQEPAKITLPSQGEDQTKEKIKTLVTKKQALIKMTLPSQDEGQAKEKTKPLENKN